MPSKRFYIGPLQGGLVTNLKPFLIPNDAFESLNNMYVFRGRTRKRFGGQYTWPETAPTPGTEQLYSRMRIQVDTLGAGTSSGTVPGSKGAVGQLFSIGNNIFTVPALGTPVTLLKFGTASTYTFNTSSGVFVFTGVAAANGTPVFWYPALPIMGVAQFEGFVINDEPTYVFDTKFAYLWNNGWARSGTAIWTGDNGDFFWTTSWIGLTDSDSLFFATNFHPADPMRYLDISGDWTDYTPILSITNRFRTARIVLPFKDRLIFLNTWENVEGTNLGTTDVTTGNFSATISGPILATVTIGATFIIGYNTFVVTTLTAGPQSMTVTAIPSIGGTASTGTFDASTGAVSITGMNENALQAVYFLPNSTGNGNLINYANRCDYSLNGTPLNPWSMYQSPGLGGYIDAPTKEQIVTAGFLKDRLIVGFEASTWELVYTGNEILPFRWQKINTELGYDSTFSLVNFDQIILGIGNVGIHACNGTSVQRIDSKIPDFVFSIEDDGVGRVQGIRDYKVEQVYWTIPDTTYASTYPTQVLVYDYVNNNWALNDDSITAFGYFSNQTSLIWANWTQTWQESTWQWNTGSNQQFFRQVLAGNQEGYVFIVNPDITRNAGVLQITQISGATLTVVDHNLQQGDYIAIENANGVTYTNVINKVITINTANSIDIDAIPTGSYLGGGTLARVSKIDVLTKQYNFAPEGGNMSINKIDFLVDSEVDGEITILPKASTSDFNLQQLTMETSPYPANLYPLEQTQAQLWHSIYPSLNGEYCQLEITLSDIEMRDTATAWSDLQIHAMVFYVTTTSSRLE